MLKKMGIAVLLLVSSLRLCSQTIKGAVLDGTLAPVPYASVAILKTTDSSIVKGSITNEKGIYFFDHVPDGTYCISASCIGYHTAYSDALNIQSPALLTVPDIVLNNQTALGEVSVSAIRSPFEFKDGNVTVNVEHSALAKGNTVYDLLLKLPGVGIDDNTISMNGKAGVIIMIDGRVEQLSNIQLINLLRSMNAEVVEKIELLRNPPVKYDASGTSGMIHIRTKKTKVRGFSGSVYSTYSQGTYARGMAGFSLNYKLRDITVFSNMDGDYGYYGVTQQFNRTFISDTAITGFENRRYTKNREKNFMYKFGMDWQAGKNSILGFKIDGGPGAYIANEKGLNMVKQDNYMGYDHLSSFTYGPSNWEAVNYNLNAEHRFDTTGTTLNATADYTLLKENTRNVIENYFLDASEQTALPPNIYQTDNSSASTVLTFRLDFTKKVSETSSLETGAKAGLVKTRNDYFFKQKNNLTDEFISDTAMSNKYSYEEQTFAGYFNYRKVMHKLNMQVGLRIEHTLQEGKNTEKGFTLKKRYVNPFPNISFEYKASEKHSWQLNLNRRIDRPAFIDLNPFRIYFDQYYYYQGNPFLLPHYSYTSEITYRFRELLTQAMSFSYIDQVMTDYNSQTDSIKLLVESKKNMNYQKYASYSFFLQHDLKKWWNFSVNGLIHYIEYSGDLNGLNFHTKRFSYSLSSTHTFIAGKNTKMELNGFYKSGLNTGVGEMKFIWMVSFAIRQTFLKDKLDVSIGINDIFKSLVGRSATDFANQHWDYKYMPDSRRLTLTLNYNFGQLKIIQRSTGGNEDEKKRLQH
jgi:hypothetical protein